MEKKKQDTTHAHFKGKDATQHVAETQVDGMIASAEIHGAEMPGHLFAAAEAAKETAIFLLVIWIVLTTSGTNPLIIGPSLLTFSVILLFWKGGRSAWLGWSRLERLHRLLEQEKWEIEHHRQQEREELIALYQAKGFEGQLLEDVVDVLMADGDRLLRIMIEEELGLSLQSQEHPLKQGFGASIGSFFTSTLCLLSFWLFPSFGIWIASLAALTSSALLYATYQKNRLIPAVIWNLGLAVICAGLAFFLLQFFEE